MSWLSAERESANRDAIYGEERDLLLEIENLRAVMKSDNQCYKDNESLRAQLQKSKEREEIAREALGTVMNCGYLAAAHVLARMDEVK